MQMVLYVEKKIISDFKPTFKKESERRLTVRNNKIKKYAIKSICKDLSSDLLNRYLGGYMQNSNENFNSFVWLLRNRSQVEKFSI